MQAGERRKARCLKINNLKEVTKMGVKQFFKNAFSDMKADAKAQHEVDKANLAAVKAESKANFAEAKAMGKTETRKAIMQAQRDEQIKEANERKAAAEARLEEIKGNK